MDESLDLDGELPKLIASTNHGIPSLSDTEQPSESNVEKTEMELGIVDAESVVLLPELMIEKETTTIEKNGSDSSDTESDDENDAGVEQSQKLDTDIIEQEQEAYYGWPYELSQETEILECLSASPKSEYQGRCLRGCKWAPDGSCLITNSEDRTLRLFNIPTSLNGVSDWSTYDEPLDDNWQSVLKVKEGGQVYDYCWFPFMTSMDPETACFLTTAQDNPVHLWDAFTGQLRATYTAVNYADVVIAALSVTFDAYGEKIYCGYHNGVRIFDVARPGRTCVHRQHSKGSILPDLNLSGIVSCIAVSPYGSSCYACGSYDRRIGIYVEDGTPVAVLQGHIGGVTSLKFNRDGTKLFSGGRKDSRLICWDMRNLGTEYEIFERVVDTSQRIYFDLSPNEKYLVSGCTDGKVRVWDLEKMAPTAQAHMELDDFGAKLPHKPLNTFQCSTDCVNGISLNPYLPLMAVSTGQRHFYDLADDDEEEIFVQSPGKALEEIGIRLFKFT